MDIDRVTFISPAATRRGSMPLSLLYFSSLLQSFQCPCAPRSLSPGKALQSYNLFPNRQNFQRKILNFFRHRALPRLQAPPGRGCAGLRRLPFLAESGCKITLSSPSIQTLSPKSFRKLCFLTHPGAAKNSTQTHTAANQPVTKIHTNPQKSTPLFGFEKNKNNGKIM